MKDIWFKKLKENGIEISNNVLSSKTDENGFAKKLLNIDYHNLIDMARYLQSILTKNNKQSAIKPKKIIDYIEADIWIRSACWFLIRRIEEKLTSTMQWKLGFRDHDYSNADFYDLDFSKIRSQKKEQVLKEKNDIILWVQEHRKKEENKLLNKNPNSEIKETNSKHNIPFETFISNISLGKKLRILSSINQEKSSNILNRFSEINPSFNLLRLINDLRNEIAHHGLILNRVFNLNNKKIRIAELIEQMKTLSDSKTTKTFDTILNSANDIILDILISENIIKNKKINKK